MAPDVHGSINGKKPNAIVSVDRNAEVDATAAVAERHSRVGLAEILIFIRALNGLGWIPQLFNTDASRKMHSPFSSLPITGRCIGWELVLCTGTST